MLISVIVPAYNAERWLGYCLDSILCQGHERTEVICVDDGSADNTSQILEDYAKRDERIIFVRQDNKGVSAARNEGLARAQGDVVLFADADDWLLPGALQAIDATFSQHHPDCAVFGLTVEPPEATPMTLSHRLAPRDGVYESFSPDLIFKENSHPYAFRVAFSRSFLNRNGLAFDTKLKLGEDEAFLMTAYRLSHKTMLCSRRIYGYRMDASSASHRNNASDDVLPTKLSRHLDLVSSVLEEWRRRGFDQSCDEQVLVWALDLLLLDLSRLPKDDQATYYQRLYGILLTYFGTEPRTRGVMKRCLSNVREARMPLRHLVAFYIHSRGLVAVLERAYGRLKGRGAY